MEEREGEREAVEGPLAGKNMGRWDCFSRISLKLRSVCDGIEIDLELVLTCNS